MNTTTAANTANDSLDYRLKKKIIRKNRLFVFVIIESVILLILFPGLCSFFSPLYDVLEAIHVVLAELLEILTDQFLRKLSESGYDIRYGYQRFMSFMRFVIEQPGYTYIAAGLLSIPYLRLFLQYMGILRLKQKIKSSRPKTVLKPGDEEVTASSQERKVKAEQIRRAKKMARRKKRAEKSLPLISFGGLLPLMTKICRNLSVSFHRKKISGTAVMEIPAGGYLRVQKIGPHDQQDRINERIYSWNSRNSIEIPADLNDGGRDRIKFSFDGRYAWIVINSDGQYRHHKLEKNVPLLLVKNIKDPQNPKDDIPNYTVTWICGADVSAD